MRLPALFVLLVTALASARGQTCTDAHYRWTAKTTLSLEGNPATSTTPSAMLKWSPLDLYRLPPGTPVCTARSDRELEVYSLTGWARSWHIEKGPKGDLDWHISSVTAARATTPSDPR